MSEHRHRGQEHADSHNEPESRHSHSHWPILRRYNTKKGRTALHFRGTKNALLPMPSPPPFRRVVNGMGKSQNPEVPGESFVCLVDGDRGSPGSLFDAGTGNH